MAYENIVCSTTQCTNTVKLSKVSNLKVRNYLLVITENLTFRKVCVRWIPPISKQLLSLKVFKEFSAWFLEKELFLESIATWNETGVYHYTFDSKEVNSANTLVVVTQLWAEILYIEYLWPLHNHCCSSAFKWDKVSNEFAKPFFSRTTVDVLKQ